MPPPAYGPPPQPKVEQPPVGPDGMPLHSRVDTTSNGSDLAILESMFRYLMYLMAISLAGALIAYMWFGFRTYREPTKPKPAVASGYGSESEVLDGEESQGGVTEEVSSGPRSVTEALAALESRAFTVDVIADYLAAEPVDELRRDEVSGTLADYLADHLLRESTQDKLLMAIEHWVGPDAVPGLSRGLSSRRLEGEQAKTAIRVLAQVNTREAADAIAPLLADPELADTAFEALRSMGSVASPAVARQAGGTSTASRRARQLLEELGGSADSAQIDEKLAQLNDPSPLQRRAAAAWFATATVDPLRQVEVLAALEQARENSGVLERTSLDRAITRWGAAAAASGSVVGVGSASSPSGIGGVSSSSVAPPRRLTAEEIDELAGKDDPASLEALANLLGDPIHGAKVAQALVDKGPKAKPYVLQHVHAPDGDTRLGARNVLAALDVTLAELVFQSISDLRSQDSKRQDSAGDWLVSAKLDDNQRRLAAEAAAPLIGSGDPLDGTGNTAAKRVLARHGGADQSRQLLVLLADEDQKIWSPALTNLAAINDPKIAPWVVPRAAELLSSPIDQREAYAALLAAGAAGEETSIALLNPGFDPVVIGAAIAVLHQVGTEKSISPLSSLEQYARRNRAGPIMKAADEAQKEIRKRTSGSAAP